MVQNVDGDEQVVIVHLTLVLTSNYHRIPLLWLLPQHSISRCFFPHTLR